MTDNKPKQRTRSPAYPYIGLRSGVDYLRTFYKQNREYHCPVNDAIEGLGYSILSSTGFRVISGMLQFGLLEEEGTKEDRAVWVSELAREIALDFYEPDSSEYVELLQKTALRPKIYSQLYDFWGVANNGQLPPEAAMRRDLVKNYDFNPKVLEQFITDFTDTLTFAKLLGAKETGDESDNKPMLATNKGRENSNQNAMVTPAVFDTQSNLGGRSFAFPTDKGDVVLTIPHRLSVREYEKFLQWLDLIDYQIRQEENNSNMGL